MKRGLLWGIAAVAMSFGSSHARDAGEMQGTEGILELISELHREGELMPHCQRAFTREWSMVNMSSGKLEVVSTSGAVGMDHCHLMVVRDGKEESLRIPVSMMGEESRRFLRDYVSYAGRCRETLSAMIAANGGERVFSWTDVSGRAHRSTVCHALVQFESDPASGKSPKSISLYATEYGALSADWVPWTAISEASRDEFLRMAALKSEKPRDPAPVANPGLPRDEVPSFNQSDFKGGQSENCGPNAVANFVVWWDQIGLLPLPVLKRSTADRAEWVHQRLYGSMRSGGGTSLDAIVGGFRSYLTRYYPKIAAADFVHLGGSYRMDGVKPGKFTIQNVVEHVKDANATILTVTQIKNGKPAAGHYVSLTTADMEGNVTLNTWGYRFRGKLRMLTEEEIRQLPGRLLGSGVHGGVKVFEVVVSNPSESMSRMQTRWLVMPYDGLLVIKPRLLR